MSSIILVLYYLLMWFGASFSHGYRAARSSKRAGSIFSSVYIDTAARLGVGVDDVFDWLFLVVFN